MENWVFPSEESSRGSGKKVGRSTECVRCSLSSRRPVVTVTALLEAEQRSKGPRVPEGIPEPGNDLMIAGVTVGVT